jgi:alkyl sulfatase BDS1-like metallo-beta-lactamase superfamily hydrolase
MAFDAVYPFADERDFTDADRGFVAALEPGVSRNASGEVAWDNDSYSFLSGAAPDTVDPSLWRQSALNEESS